MTANEVDVARYADCFSFKHWSLALDSGELCLHYATDRYGEFTERYVFPGIDAQRYQRHQTQIDAAIDCLHWMAGVSYYKTSLAKVVRLTTSQPSTKQAAWLTETWQAGLAELAVANGLTWLDHINISGTEVTGQATPAAMNLRPRSLVAIGGGKDSLVAAEAIKAMSEEASLFMVGQSTFIPQVANHTDLPLLQIHRQVDGRLGVVNQQGAFNGHVPITAINGCVAVVAALLYDYDSVVFANERSADSGNFALTDGRWVNHQYSKSFTYERSWQAIIKDHICQDLDCFSLLRPFSELAIVKQFASLPQYFAHFSSCNRNFHLSGSKNQHHHWCGACPKCAFVFLCLAPFISRTTLLGIFQKDLFADPQLADLFESLLGIKGNKPFECVGEEQECRLALQLLQQHPDWAENTVLQAWHLQLPTIDGAAARQLMQASQRHQIPAKRRFLQVMADAN